MHPRPWKVTFKWTLHTIQWYAYIHDCTVCINYYVIGTLMGINNFILCMWTIMFNFYILWVVSVCSIRVTHHKYHALNTITKDDHFFWVHEAVELLKLKIIITSTQIMCPLIQVHTTLDRVRSPVVMPKSCKHPPKSLIISWIWFTKACMHEG